MKGRKMKTRLMRSLLVVAVVAMVVGVSVGPVGAVEASDLTIVIPAGPPWPQGPEGSRQLAAGPFNAPACELADVTVSTENNKSINTGQALVVTSSPNEVVVMGIEDAGFISITLTKALVIAGPINVYYLFGPPEIISAGFIVEVACNDNPPPEEPPPIEEPPPTIGPPEEPPTTSLPPTIESGDGGYIDEGGWSAWYFAVPAFLFVLLAWVAVERMWANRKETIA